MGHFEDLISAKKTLLCKTSHVCHALSGCLQIPQSAYIQMENKGNLSFRTSIWNVIIQGKTINKYVDNNMIGD